MHQHTQRILRKTWFHLTSKIRFQKSTTWNLTFSVALMKRCTELVQKNALNSKRTEQTHLTLWWLTQQMEVMFEMGMLQLKTLLTEIVNTLIKSISKRTDETKELMNSEIGYLDWVLCCSKSGSYLQCWNPTFKCQFELWLTCCFPNHSFTNHWRKRMMAQLSGFFPLTWKTHM